MEKRNVKVIAEFCFEGDLTPLSIELEDGTKLDIDYVSKPRRQHSPELGVTGVVYNCKIEGKDIELYLEDVNYKRIPGARWWI